VTPILLMHLQFLKIPTFLTRTELYLYTH
jgi:hypothetical protein